MNGLLQLLSILVSLAGSYLLSGIFTKLVRIRRKDTVQNRKVIKILDPLLFPFLWSLLQWTLVAASKEFQIEYSLSRSAAVFITAWVAMRLMSIFQIQKNLQKLVNTLCLTVALLDILGLLPHLVAIMDNIGFTIGDLHLSLLTVLKGGITFGFLIWSATLLSRRLERELKSSLTIEPSLQALFYKLIRVTLVAFSVLVAMSSVGLNLSAFAVFGGAIGVGIGFGLQKVVSNLICGIILLLDRSIKPGDVIALDQGKTYGEVIHLGARCVSVRTRSGKEHLIPNEDFITHKSENWSHTDSLLRVTLPIRAALNSDVPLVMELLLQSIEGVQKILKNPEPGVRLKGFSDSAIEFELRVWINEPQKGLSKVRSDIYVNIWKLFKENDIIIPHQQQDIYLKQAGKIETDLEDRLDTLHQKVQELISSSCT